MEEPQDSIIRSFSLYPKHIDYLEKINENISFALRMILDDNIQRERRNKVKTTIDEFMIWICFGLIFFIMSLLLEGFISIIPLFFGIAVLTYGLIGGINVALSRTRK